MFCIPEFTATPALLSAVFRETRRFVYIALSASSELFLLLGCFCILCSSVFPLYFLFDFSKMSFLMVTDERTNLSNAQQLGSFHRTIIFIFL